MRIIKKIFLVGLTLAVFLVPAVNANASSTKSLSKSDEQNIEKFVEQTRQYELDDKTDKENFEKKAESLIENENTKIYNKNLDFKNSKLHTKLSDGTKILSVNIKENDFHEASNVSFFFDKNNNIVDYAEFQLKKSKKNTFQVVTYTNGKLQVDKVSDVPFITAKDYRNQNNGGIQTQGVNWSKFLNCMGIPGVAASVIGSICGVACAITAGTGCIACAITAGTGCIACAVGVLGFNGGSIGVCLGKAWD
ncbi:lipopolysaccharide export LptBFGC system permease protein LptF [Croceifilum oryzae]|uniref:Lipopolysaccharide export LptBFGC system permease protein LptF n=1 Tax=Croceifilum oryzae TaxID=1553429 RepID=A0AAJ1TL95_9BACL|nr:hypothetical protein [Croceifilum oryzae]MDQ0418577.1 lipopolysaccharide export LptBFGC system permease protein LptF [Croceifilum oryzae]